MVGRKNGVEMRLDPEGPRADQQEFREEKGEERVPPIRQDAREGRGGGPARGGPTRGAAGGRVAGLGAWAEPRAPGFTRVLSRAGGREAGMRHVLGHARPELALGKSQSRCFSQVSGWGPVTSQQPRQAPEAEAPGAGSWAAAGRASERT